MLTSAGELYYMVSCCVCLTSRGNLFLSLSAHSIVNISWWVFWMALCCVFMYMHAWPFLTLSACSIANISWWVLQNGLVLCICMFDQMFLSACFIAMISQWVLFVMCICEWSNRSNLTVSLFVCLLQCQHQPVSLLNGLLLCICEYIWPEITCFSPFLLTPLPTSGCEFYWMILCCIFWKFEQK